MPLLQSSRPSAAPHRAHDYRSCSCRRCSPLCCVCTRDCGSASLMRMRTRPDPTEAALEVRDATPKPLCKPEIQPPLPRLPLPHRVTHFFISPASHSMSLKSYFLSACLLPKPALHQCIRLIESSVLGDSSVMTHDIQLMLSFLPGGLILEIFSVLGWHVERLSCYLTIKSFRQDNFQTSGCRYHLIYCALNIVSLPDLTLPSSPLGQLLRLLDWR